MSEVIEFPRRMDGSAPPPDWWPGLQNAAPGDLLVICLNPRLYLWCAWPVAVVDHAGWPMAVLLTNGRVSAVERLAATGEQRRLFRLADHDPARFHDLSWKTFASLTEAERVFAAIATPEARP